jgi:predicted TIM-barrel fold metal-dependent hydrolase
VIIDAHAGPSLRSQGVSPAWLGCRSRQAALSRHASASSSTPSTNSGSFVGVSVNPDPCEGRGGSPALGDRYWYPLYERLVEYDVPMHVHAAGCYSERETYSEHFITEESIAILSMLRGTVFRDFPDLRVMISHGGGSVPSSR